MLITNFSSFCHDDSYRTVIKVILDELQLQHSLQVFIFHVEYNEKIFCKKNLS